MLMPHLPAAVRSEQQAAERNAQELLATEAQSKSHPEGGQKKSKKKKKVDVLRFLLQQTVHKAVSTISC